MKGHSGYGHALRVARAGTPALVTPTRPALAKDPAERATAGEMALGLREVLAARGVTEAAGVVAGFVRGMP